MMKPVGDDTGVERQPSRYLRRIPVGDRARSLIHFLKVENIEWIESENQYLRIHLAERSYLARGPMMTLRYLAAHLDPRRFMRVHRSHLINLDRVIALRTDAAPGGFARLDGGQDIAVSQRYWLPLQEALIGGAPAIGAI